MTYVAKEEKKYTEYENLACKIYLSVFKICAPHHLSYAIPSCYQSISIIFSIVCIA